MDNSELPIKLTPLIACLGLKTHADTGNTCKHPSSKKKKQKLFSLSIWKYSNSQQSLTRPQILSLKMFKVSLKSNPRVRLLLRLVIRLLGETRGRFYTFTSLFTLISSPAVRLTFTTEHWSCCCSVFFFVSDDTLWTKDALFYILLLKIWIVWSLIKTTNK